MKWMFAPVVVFCMATQVCGQAREDVATLIKQLKDKDEIIRLKAAKALGKFGVDARDAIPALTDALKDPDEDVRSVAKQALAKIKEAVQAADKDESLALLTKHLKNIKSPNADARTEAVAALAKMLKHDDDIIRLKAVQGLGSAGLVAKTALKELEATAHDPDELVRREARKAIAKIEALLTEERKALAREKLAPLLKDLKSKVPATRKRAADAIAEMGGDAGEASEELIGALTDRTPGVQQSALEALEKVNPALHKQVVTLLVDQNLEAKREAIVQLGRMEADARPAVGLLIRFYHLQVRPDPNNPTQHRYGEDLLKVLRRIHPDNKDVVATILGALPLSQHSFLLNTQVVIDSQVRSQAIVLTLDLIQAKKLDPGRAVKPFLAALGDLSCRIQAIKALGELGVEAKDAIATLTKLKVDPDMATREAATEALKMIQ